jgi:probable rRNA maturation factor
VPAGGLAAWLRRVAPPRARGTVNVALVSDREIQRLNRGFRGKNTATDVLSFCAARPFQGRGQCHDRGHLGDIAIATGVARRQARELGHSQQTEWRVLALHGLLHLLGYDHENDDGRMQRLERKLRRKGGLRDGLIDRTR